MSENKDYSNRAPYKKKDYLFGDQIFNSMNRIKLKNKVIVTIISILILVLFGCDKKEIVTEPEKIKIDEIKENDDMILKLFIDEKEIPIVWENNEAVKALYEYTKNNPLNIDMRMYGGFEQVGSLGTNLPTEDHNIVTEAGDIVLYNGNQIVIFYESNSWAYTKLGKIDNANEEYMKQLLAEKDVKVTIIVE